MLAWIATYAKLGYLVAVKYSNNLFDSNKTRFTQTLIWTYLHSMLDYKAHRILEGIHFRLLLEKKPLSLFSHPF